MARHSALIRYAQSPWIDGKACEWNQSQEARNVAAARDFFQWAAPKFPVAIVLVPAVEPRLYADYYAGSKLPVLHWSAAGKGADYGEIHPPAEVFEWYATELVARMRRAGLLER